MINNDKPLSLRRDISYSLYDFETEKPVLAVDLLYARRFVLFEDDAARVLGNLIRGKTVSEVLAEIRVSDPVKGEEYADQTIEFLNNTAYLIFDIPGEKTIPFGGKSDPFNDSSFTLASVEKTGFTVRIASLLTPVSYVVSIVTIPTIMILVIYLLRNGRG